jgi:hypothetical protein
MAHARVRYRPRTLFAMRGSYGIDHLDHRALVVAWGAADVAVQFRMGILSERRIRSDSADSPYLAADGQIVDLSAAPGTFHLDFVAASASEDATKSI